MLRDLKNRVKQMDQKEAEAKARQETLEQELQRLQGATRRPASTARRRQSRTGALPGTIADSTPPARRRRMKSSVSYGSGCGNSNSMCSTCNADRRPPYLRPPLPGMPTSLRKMLSLQALLHEMEEGLQQATELYRQETAHLEQENEQLRNQQSQDDPKPQEQSRNWSNSSRPARPR